MSAHRKSLKKKVRLNKKQRKMHKKTIKKKVVKIHPLKRKSAASKIVHKDDKLWPEEDRALDNIVSGKTKTERVSGEDFLKELKSLVNES